MHTESPRAPPVFSSLLPPPWAQPWSHFSQRSGRYHLRSSSTARAAASSPGTSGYEPAAARQSVPPPPPPPRFRITLLRGHLCCVLAEQWGSSGACTQRATCSKTARARQMQHVTSNALVTIPDRFGRTYISHMHTVAVIAICTTRLSHTHTRQEQLQSRDEKG